MWAPMYGVWFSSTRTELMGLITAMLLPAPAHLGIDNSTVVQNFGKLCKKAEELDNVAGVSSDNLVAGATPGHPRPYPH